MSTSYTPLHESPPPSLDSLHDWANTHGVVRHASLRPVKMLDSTGWRMTADQDVRVGTVLCTVPKHAIFSYRTASFSQLVPLDLEQSTSSDVILHLAACLLHELRLGVQSDWYGYLQILPRETVMVPTFWGDSRLGGEDGGRALEWLKGTEAERELNRKEGEGLSLGNMERFYTDISPHFPSTTNHPSRSPFLSYVYAISLIMTRAVVVDAYHGIAIVPFCDLLNHSSIAHTSFCCDAFVCPTCGSLTHCEHDTPAIERLAHLPRNFVETMEEKSNVVDMRVERAINAGEEVFMSYDENVGDGKLLVEWGFVERKGGGDGLVWSPRELLDGTTARAYMMLINSDHIDNASQYTQNAATHHHLIAQPNPEQNPLLNVNPKGEASIYLITAAYLQLQSEADDLRDVDEMGEEIVTIVEEVVQKSVEDESTLGPLAKALTSRIVNLIDRRLARMYEAETTLGELVNLHANLPLTATLERMAMALAIDERCVLEGALTRWRALLG